MRSPNDALRDGVEALVRRQEDGHWEGEMRWCPMLTAQYVIFHHVLARPLRPERAARIHAYFQAVQHEDGAWGLHDHSGPSLFVTTLVYVAARLSGAGAEDAWLAPARALFAREPVATIPTWGRVWLALVGLYEWEGMHPMPPELWALPEALPFHPSRFYCHVRMIYLGLGLLRAAAPSAAPTPLVAALRRELHPWGPYEAIDFRAHRGRVSALDLVAPLHPLVGVGFAAAELFERVHPRALRARIIAELGERIRWELRTTDHLGVSPVSGMLGLLALALVVADADDPDVARGVAALEGWAWDDEDGYRLTGARSQTWDTAFAIQSLVAASPHNGGEAVARGVEYLAAQQIRGSFPGFADAHRIDPEGGFCFAHREHGWPVSDCSAEALVALLAVEHPRVAPERMHDAVRFLLRCRNADGGFGSYEAMRGTGTLDWLNPSEMFLDCVTERSYVECTASCVVALVEWRARFPSHPLAAEVGACLARASAFLRRAQNADGSWSGAWGVHRLYGTLFGVRALRALGATPADASIARAARFLRDTQRADGSWGEHEDGAAQDRFVPLDHGHPVQTSWALSALVESGTRESQGAIDRAVGFLVRAQLPDGTWPADRMVGVFFRTALLEYELYRIYFPVWALGLAEEARRRRAPSGPGIVPTLSTSHRSP